jgi:hypothetical protein
MKKVIIAFASLLTLTIVCFLLFPDLIYNFPLGQRVVLSVEGDKAAFFYYSPDQSVNDTLYMEGVIYSNTHKDLQKIFKENKNIKTLSMVNVPGSIDDKINLKASLLIREEGISTYIPKDGMVASGGTDMFLAGLRRSAHKSARVGVHSWREGKLNALDYAKEHAEHIKFVDYYRKIDIPEEFYWYTLEVAPPNEIHWMTMDEMALYNVLTFDFDSQNLLKIQRLLASDEYQGRRSGENELAQNLIDSCFRDIGLEYFNNSYKEYFEFSRRGGSEKITGANIIGSIKGTKHPESYIVIGAHYDHLGVRNGDIYNGADDNASGTAALIIIADYLKTKRPEHSIIFAAFDAEEMGLKGSRHFVDNPPPGISNILLNINMDMISHNTDYELFIVGTHYFPEYRSVIEQVSKGSPLIVSYGHDNPDNHSQDYWMNSSDNGPFHNKGIANITFSVEDHDDYHTPLDDFENTNPGLYLNAVDLIINSIETIDKNLNTIRK